MPSEIRADHDSLAWSNVEKKELENIKGHLDLIIIALEAIANISSEAIVQAAQELGLESIISDRLTLWRLRSANPHRKTSQGRKKLDVEEARALVLVICFLAKKHHELLRRAVLLLEQASEQEQPPHQTALLGNYLDNFVNFYQERLIVSSHDSGDLLVNLAWKLLIDLLFYSGQNGSRLLWMAILDATQISVVG